MHAPSLAAVYSEIFRVLKSGSRFGVKRMGDAKRHFDTSNSRHTFLRHGIERGNGIVQICTSAEAEAAMSSAGFILEKSGDLGDNNDPIPWWYVCSGSTEFAKTWTDWGRVARMTLPSRVALKFIIESLEFVGIARKGTAAITRDDDSWWRLYW